MTAITPITIIQGHRFWYQSKAHIICDFLLVNSNILSRTVSKLLQIGQIFAFYIGVPLFHILVRGELLRNSATRNEKHRILSGVTLNCIGVDCECDRDSHMTDTQNGL